MSNDWRKHTQVEGDLGFEGLGIGLVDLGHPFRDHVLSIHSVHGDVLWLDVPGHLIQYGV